MSENLYRKVTAEEIEYEKQESRYRFMLDMNTMKSVAANKQREIARNMKDRHIDLKTIFEITGLPLAEIEAL